MYIRIISVYIYIRIAVYLYIRRYPYVCMLSKCFMIIHHSEVVHVCEGAAAVMPSAD